MLCIGSVSASAFAQDSTQTGRTSNMNTSDRIAARDMTGNITPPALPVMQTFVPPEVMSQAGSKYGKNLYAVTMLKVNGGTDAYQVMILDNQTPRFEWIGADGSTIADIYRVDTGGMATGAPVNSTMPMNNNGMNNNNSTRSDSSARMNNSTNNNASMSRDSSGMMNNATNNNANRSTDSSRSMNNMQNNPNRRRDSTQNMPPDTLNRSMNNPAMSTDSSRNSGRDSVRNNVNNPGQRRDTGNRRGMDTSRNGDSSSSLRFNKGVQEMMIVQKHFAPFHKMIFVAPPKRTVSAFYRREQALHS